MYSDSVRFEGEFSDFDLVGFKREFSDLYSFRFVEGCQIRIIIIEIFFSDLIQSEMNPKISSIFSKVELSFCHHINCSSQKWLIEFKICGTGY